MKEIKRKLLYLIKNNGQCYYDEVPCNECDCPIWNRCGNCKDTLDIKREATNEYLELFTEDSLVEELL